MNRYLGGFNCLFRIQNTLKQKVLAKENVISGRQALYQQRAMA